MLLALQLNNLLQGAGVGAPLPNRTVYWRRNVDNTMDGHWPAGDKNPSVATLEWDDISALASAVANNVIGDGAFSHDVRQYLSGTAAATATLSISTVSGDDAAAEGWTYSADNLTHPDSNAGGGFFRLGATHLGDTVFTDPIAWLWSDPVVDTIAPTIPTRLVGVADENQITWSWDAATDPPDDADPGSFVDEYDLDLNGAVTVVAGSPNLSVPVVLENIGSSTPSPGDSRTGAAGTMSGGGTGFQGTADQGPFWYAQISGDFTATLKVTAFTSPGHAFAPCGLMARETLDANSKFRTVYVQRSNNFAQSKVRATVGGTATNQANSAAALTGTYWVQIKRVGDLWTESYSEDGNAFTDLVAAASMPLASTLYVGRFLSSRINGTAVTADYEQFSLSNVGRVSYVQSTTTANRIAKVRARDLAGTPNVSAYSPTVTQSPIVSAIPAISWNPGPGILSPGVSSHSVANMAAAAAAGAICWEQMVYWRDIETSRGVYALGPGSYCYQVLQDAKANGLRLILQPWKVGPTLPAYLDTELNGGQGWFTMDSGQRCAKIYTAAINTRQILMFQAIGTAFDSDPKFEGIRNGESSIGAPGSSQSDYNAAEYLTQYRRLITEIPPYFPQSNVWVSLNFGFTQTAFPGLLQLMEDNRCGIGDPDVFTSNTDHSTNGARASRGLVWNGTAWVTGGKDFRGRIPIQKDWQTPELGGKENNLTTPESLDTMYAHAVTVNGDNHGMISMKGFKISPNPPTDLYWDNNSAAAQADPLRRSPDIKTWMTAGGHPFVTTVPWVYTQNGRSVVTGA